MNYLDKKIAILMATYNGEAFIKEQLDSLLSQTLNNLLIYIRDDCSVDNTYLILKEYQQKHPNKIVLSQNEKNSGSGKNVFFDLIQEVEADYYLLCDQDDVWIENKVQVLVDHIETIEESNIEMPILVHSDAFVVNQSLNLISNSLIKRMKLDKVDYSFNHALSQNVITGCTTIFNKNLKNLLDIKPEFFIMHDWWIYLIAISFGIVEKNSEKLIYYRLHQNNSVGAENSANILSNFRKFLKFDKNQLMLYETYIQANNFFILYNNKMTNNQISLIKLYKDLYNENKIKRIINLLRYRFYKIPLLKAIGHLLYV